MKYSINIIGMHCSGCRNLIKIILEDFGYSDINISLEEKKANFITDKAREEIAMELNKVFQEDLKDYQYTNLTPINNE